jgi:hypothetical protein
MREVSNGSGTVTSINAYDEYGIPAASNVGREFGGIACVTGTYGHYTK